MLKIIRTVAARNDMRNIGRYTLKVWGKTQTDLYLDDLEESIDSLATNPRTRGQDRGDGKRSLSHRNHYFIFYRVQNDAVIILRVLHQRSNWQRQF